MRHSAEMANEADDWLARATAALERELRAGLVVQPTPIQMSPDMLAEYEALCASEATALIAANSVPRFFTKETDPSRYPHTCPRCSGPAYVGAVEVDCAGGCK